MAWLRKNEESPREKKVEPDTVRENCLRGQISIYLPLRGSLQALGAITGGIVVASFENCVPHRRQGVYRSRYTNDEDEEDDNEDEDVVFFHPGVYPEYDAPGCSEITETRCLERTSRINEFHYGNSYGAVLSLLMSSGNDGTYYDLPVTSTFAFGSPKSHEKADSARPWIRKHRRNCPSRMHFD